MTPFCYNRTDGCSGHGDCRASLHNITCECDDGYIGGRCETKTCDLKCQHGGTPYDDCTKCDGCKGAWGGKLCDQWNEGIEYMAKLIEEGKLKVKETIVQGFENMGGGKVQVGG